MVRQLVAIACLGATLSVGNVQAGQEQCAWISRIEDANFSRILDNVECLRNPNALNCIRTADQSPPMIEEERLKRIKALPIDQERKASLRSKHIWIGANEEMACLAWGKPNDVNRTITRSMLYEQWVYGGKNFLYLEDGVVTAIQD